jgi:hypothetical protein
MSNTPNMNLPVPTPGITPGPQYAQQQVLEQNIIDAHNHTPGYGVLVPTAGLNINTNLPFNNNQAVALQAAVFTPQTGLSTLYSLYFSGVDAYINDGAGNIIRLTSGGTVNATSSGISSGTASASFSSGVLVVNSAPSTPADIQVASVLLGNNVANSKYLTLAPPASMAANYNLVLPPLPAVLSFVTLDTSGNLTGSIAVAGALTTTNLSATAGILGTQLANLTITGAQIANQTITATQIANTTITAAQIANATITSTQVAAGTITPNNMTYELSTASISSFSSSSTTPTAVTGLSATLSSSGSTRPVMIMFNGNGGGSIEISTGSGSSTAVTATIFIQTVIGLTAHTISTFKIQAGGNSTTVPQTLLIPCAAMNCIDNIWLGGTYSVLVEVSVSSAVVTFTNVGMSVIQL